jgi:transposase InsO family protein
MITTLNVDSSWRHLDLCGRVCRIRVRRRRLRCPEHGVLAEGVPFARSGSWFTRDVEQVVAWLVTKTDKTNAIFHSDRGIQYTSAAFATATDLLDIQRSVGATGVCFDQLGETRIRSPLNPRQARRQSQDHPNVDFGLTWDPVDAVARWQDQRDPAGRRPPR